MKSRDAGLLFGREDGSSPRRLRSTVMADFAEVYRPSLEAALAPGEELLGVAAANHRQSVFKGRLVAIGVTPGRLLLQPIGRKGAVDGPVQPVARQQVASAAMDGAGGGWPTVEAAIADHAAVELVLTTTEGATWKLMMMHGAGVFGGLGGGEPQRQGVMALAQWLDGLS
jgi:hypothetical protein